MQKVYVVLGATEGLRCNQRVPLVPGGYRGFKGFHSQRAPVGLRGVSVGSKGSRCKRGLQGFQGVPEGSRGFQW